MKGLTSCYWYFFEDCNKWAFIFNIFLLLDKWKQALIVIVKRFALLGILNMFICSLSFLASALKLLGRKSAGKNLINHPFSRCEKFSEKLTFLWEISIFQAKYTLLLVIPWIIQRCTNNTTRMNEVEYWVVIEFLTSCLFFQTCFGEILIAYVLNITNKVGMIEAKSRSHGTNG